MAVPTYLCYVAPDNIIPKVVATNKIAVALDFVAQGSQFFILLHNVRIWAYG
jgi:hypothetical protein